MSDEIFTPLWVFEKLNVIFDLDVASSFNEHIVVPTKNRLTIEDNALETDCYGKVWMNPPYSKVLPWITKWLDHKNGFCLVPLSSNGRWVNLLWESEAAVTFMPANMKWIGGMDGKLINHRWRCALWAIGDENIEILKNSNIGKVKQ